MTDQTDEAYQYEIEEATSMKANISICKKCAISECFKRILNEYKQMERREIKKKNRIARAREFNRGEDLISILLDEDTDPRSCADPYAILLPDDCPYLMEHIVEAQDL
jgi:hypothetical protein